MYINTKFNIGDKVYILLKYEIVLKEIFRANIIYMSDKIIQIEYQFLNTDIAKPEMECWKSLDELTAFFNYRIENGE